MNNKKTRFSIVNPHWYADLVEQQAPIGQPVESLTLDDDVISVNNQYLEISRAGNILRGGLFLGGLVIAALLCWSIPLLLRITAEPEDEIFYVGQLDTSGGGNVFFVIPDIPGLPYSTRYTSAFRTRNWKGIRLRISGRTQSFSATSGKDKDLRLAKCTGGIDAAGRLYRKSVHGALWSGTGDLPTRYK